MNPAGLGRQLRSPAGRRLLGLWLLALALGLGAYAWLRGVEERSARGHLADRAGAAALSTQAHFAGLEQRLRWAAGSGRSGGPNAAALGSLLEAQPPLGELLRLGPDGEVADASGRPPILARQFSRGQANWLLAAAAGRPYVGLLRESQEAEAGFVLVLPGPRGGAAVARVGARPLWERLEAQAPAGGRLLLLDQEGRLLARSGSWRPELQGLRPADEPGLAEALASDAAWWGRIEGPGRGAAMALAQPLEAPWPGDPDGGPGRWLIYVEAPAAALLPASRLLGQVLLFGLALLSLALVFAALAGQPDAAGGAITEVEGDRAALGRTPKATGVAGAAVQEAADLSRQDLEQVLRRLDAMVGRAKEVDRLKSEFLATISHELRTPLNSVIGYAELILSGINGPVDDETRQDVRAIHENGLVLLRIVNDLLDLAKIEADRLELELSQLDPAALVQAAVDQWRKAAEQKGLTLTWSGEADLPLIWGDGGRLNQVLSNLLSNAIKFTDRGGVTVAVAAEGGEVLIRVSDTGPGIAAEDRETIFERFRQLDGSLTRRAGGTGLGLAISRHLVRMHGGRIEVGAEAGQGATFTVVLPVEEQPSHLRGRRVGPLLW